MKKAAWCFFLTCTAAFAQDSSSGNAAADALKKRMKSMDLLNLPTPQQVGPKRLVLAGPMAAAPKVCSIPLLRVVPPETRDKMPVIKPKSRVLSGGTVQVPAPACDDATFRNK
jgi:hypothetical protein